MDKQKNIYRLIKPYQSNKVYEALTIMHGAGKCYKELKKNNTRTEDFTIININNNHIYDFKINKKDRMILEKDPTELLRQNGGDESFQIRNDMKQSENKINNIENKLITIENKLITIENKIMIIENKIGERK